MGNFECTSAVFNGTVLKNSGTEVELTFSSASITGPGPRGTCATAFLGNTIVTPKKLPWCFRAGGKLAADTFTMIAADCPTTTGTMELTLDSSTVGECSYSKTSLNGIFITGEMGDLTISDQEFLKSAGSGFCAASLKLDLTLDLYTEGTNTRVYIG
jgi:hypothetical protein